jgi:hypothetical protein
MTLLNEIGLFPKMFHEGLHAATGFFKSGFLLFDPVMQVTGLLPIEPIRRSKPMQPPASTVTDSSNPGCDGIEFTDPSTTSGNGEVCGLECFNHFLMCGFSSTRPGFELLLLLLQFN